MITATDPEPVHVSSGRDVFTFDGHILINTTDPDGTVTPSEAREPARILLASAERARRCRTEETVISTVDLLPTGRQWVFLEDCNVLALSPHLDEAGRERAIAEARRECGIR